MDDSDLGVPIYYLDGAKVADDYRDLYDGGWDSQQARNESGNVHSTGSIQVLTGSESNGTEGFRLHGGTLRRVTALGSSGFHGIETGFANLAGQELSASGTNEVLPEVQAYVYGLSGVFQVTAANNAPTFTTTALSAAENQTTAGTVVATDEDTEAVRKRWCPPSDFDMGAALLRRGVFALFMGLFARGCVSPVLSSGGQQPSQHVPASFRRPAEPRNGTEYRRSVPLGRAPFWTFARRSGTVPWAGGQTCDGSDDRIPGT